MGIVKEAIIEAMDIANKYEKVQWIYKNGKNKELDFLVEMLLKNYPNEFEKIDNKKIMEFLYCPEDIFYSLSVEQTEDYMVCELRKIIGSKDCAYTEIL